MSGRARPVVMAIGAHPDDIEFTMSGTLILLGEAGYDIHCMAIADGSCGTVELGAAEIAAIRLEESRRAAAEIGATFHPSIASDMTVFYQEDLLRRLGSVVRGVAPDIILTHSPVDYMEDHTSTCRLAVTAAFARGMRNFAVEPHAEPVDKPVVLYHAQPHGNRDPLGEIVRPKLFVDVSGVMDRKIAMLSHHASQRDWLDVSQGMDSYINAMRSLLGEVGVMSGRFEFAEGWRRHLHLGFCGETDDPMRTVLAGCCQ